MSLRALGSTLLALLLFAAPVAAHSGVEVEGYTVTIGMIGEPVAVGDDSGFELTVVRNEDQQPVAGLERTLEVSVRYGAAVRALTVEPLTSVPGHYVARFVPTVAGPYTILVAGRIEIETVSLELTAGADTYEEVLPASTRQFPAGLPSSAELADQIGGLRLLTIGALAAAVAALGVSLLPLLRRPRPTRGLRRRGRRS